MSDLRQPPRGFARSINPAAGLYEVTTDESELRACARAATRSWQHFPYYEKRYGPEGWKFGFSDSAWITTLCARGATEAVQNIRWLGAVLSSRGMPQIMLEYHLDVQREELLAENSQDKRRCAILRRCERTLAAIREKAFPPARFNRLARSFDERARSPESDRIGSLIVSAVADEASGIEHAVDSLLSFLCDPSKFPPAWIAAVQSTVAEARAAVRR